MDNNIVLKMEKICKYYPGVTALDHVDFELRKGEVHALLGENGAGKSTLCKIIAGAQPMDDGSYCLDGEQIRTLTPQSAKDKGVSMIYQEFNLVPYLKVYENMFLGKEIERGIYADKRAMIRKTREVFERFHIEIDPNSRISDLSNAYKQQVEIAKAVLENAKVLIMDEPTAPLGNREVENLFEMIRTLKSEGVSIIYISHRLEELFEISDRITVMRDGQLVATRPASELEMNDIIRLMVGRELGNQFPPKTNKPGEVYLEVEHLTGLYNNLRDVSFTARRGEIVGLAGLDGSGRTETLETMFGVATRKSGRILLDGKECKNLNPRQSIKNNFALLTEERRATGIFGILDIRENSVISSLDRHKRAGFVLSDKSMKKDTQWSIDAMHTKTPSQETKIRSLSGGNQQKVIIGRWLLTEPDVLLLDEPTRGIDVGAKYEIYQLILDLANKGKTVIMVSSEMPELLGVCDRILVMSGGRLAGEVDAKTATQEDIMRLAAKYV